ncbi:MAG: DNA-deoxyinosine glycosylase [Treponema sp.]|nr:DNA-deoxyinosine glycosylase [Treponema sp.]
MELAEKSELQKIIHQIPPVWDSESKVLILGTMPSPKSREAGFFYMHPQNRFWKVLPAVFGESLCYPNNSPDREAAISERRDFLLRHHIALWDVLASCEISGAADSSIKNAKPNDFGEILGQSKISRLFCTGKTAFSLWKKTCAEKYEERYHLTVECLPSTSPANAAWSLEKLIEAYKLILTCCLKY